MKLTKLAALVAMLSGAYVAGCAKDDLSNYSLGAETYPNFPDCKQVYFKGKPTGMFAKKLNRAEGTRLEGVACHGATVVVEATTGNWKEGTLR